MKVSKNVASVDKNRLCHGCGACSYICQSNAITLKNDGYNNYPFIDIAKCNQCGLCLKVCSGIHFDFKNTSCIEQELLLSKNNLYIGHSNQASVRQKSASGGIITQIILSLLREKIIDGAIVARNVGTIPDIGAAVVHSEEEVMNSTSSIYYPVSVCAALKQIDRNKKYIFVGKGCDLDSLNRISVIQPWIDKAIQLKIGMMCHHTPYAQETKELVESVGISNTRLTRIVYRGLGWPGDTVITSGKRQYVLPYKISWGKYLGKNIPFRCKLCFNGMAGHGDIVVGDAWKMNLLLQKDLNDGYSLFMVRTNGAQEILDKLYKKNDIIIESVAPRFLIESQKNLISKNESALCNVFIFKLLYKKNLFDNISFNDIIKRKYIYLLFSFKGLRKFASALKNYYLYMKLNK
ncbi:Coenzyme F420 hydrogenase/dehydrogenase, beta subunit C-terminal domain [Pelosinus fermentans]|uniref:Coenzyme F420 hydrogenase/dehydrogenase beta subunit domain protein n=1 Tax=Pelosinus fermentans JBW45 TaxID=1192197 RepID=I8TS09_9FIRM|nr:Coenzyme F420 hydrogenase/dehydrogenase, beta subunit C-terminal domain [Pelosinus fermentans]AJQ26014.1 coenzyme F420 hydrogenase/dehydrogenase beta subunit domain protein [Pelosinus fermentans JBW45]